MKTQNPERHFTSGVRGFDYHRIKKFGLDNHVYCISSPECSCSSDSISSCSLMPSFSFSFLLLLDRLLLKLVCMPRTIKPETTYQLFFLHFIQLILKNPLVQASFSLFLNRLCNSFIGKSSGCPS